MISNEDTLFGTISIAGMPVPSGETKHPYLSLERLGSYLYQVTFDKLAEYDGTVSVPTGCSSYVQDGKLYRNLDWYYSNTASFIIKCKGFEGMSFIDGLNDGQLFDSKIAQLPYCMVDGVNDYGIKVSTHVLYNDFEYYGSGNKDKSITRLPFTILNTIKSLDDLYLLNPYLENLQIPQALISAEYLLQILITDGAETYLVTPDTDGYHIIDITENPKLANFKWVNKATVSRTELQERPTGVERWNMMPCGLADLRFTECYEYPDRLSEFIGERGTTKDSTDEELLEIYQIAHNIYLDRERDSQTWQTMHSVVYSGTQMEQLYVQEDFTKNYKSNVSGVQSFNTRTGAVLPQIGDYSYEMVGAMQHKELLTNSDILQIWGDN